jgi:hypothetical protein
MKAHQKIQSQNLFSKIQAFTSQTGVKFVIMRLQLDMERIKKKQNKEGVK